MRGRVVFDGRNVLVARRGRGRRLRLPRRRTRRAHSDAVAGPTDEGPRRRRRRLHRQPPLRRARSAAATRSSAVDDFSTGSPAQHRSDSQGDPASSSSRPTSREAPTSPVDVILHLASPASPVDYDRLPLETLRGQLARARGGCSTSPAQPGATLPSPPPRRSTATRSSIPSPRRTGATSTPSARAPATTRRSASARRSITSTRRVHGVRANDRPALQHVRPADAARRRPGHPRTGLGRARRAGRCRSTATAARRARSAT